MVGDYTKLSFENVDFIFWNYPLFNFSTCEDKAVWSPTVSMIPALEKKIWIKKKKQNQENIKNDGEILDNSKIDENIFK